MFDPYNITNQEDLNEAVAPVDRHRQVNGKHAANTWVEAGLAQ